MTFDTTSPAGVVPADAALDIWPDCSTSAPAALTADGLDAASTNCSFAGGWPASHLNESRSIIPPTTSERFKGTYVPSFYHCNPDRRLPKLDHTCQDRIIQITTKAGARDGSGKAITAEMPQLSLQRLQTYSDSFFTGFNDSVAMIHRPTFQPSAAEPLLLLAILLLGAGCRDDSSCELALCIYDAIPGLVLQHHILSKNPELSTMQALFLLASFGRARGNQQQYDVAHMYHTLLVQ